MQDDESTISTILGLIVRHGLSGVAGFLVTLGVLKDADRGAFIAIIGGIISGLVALAWSWWQKQGQRELAELLKKLTAQPTTPKAVNVALNAPRGAAVAVKNTTIS